MERFEQPRNRYSDESVDERIDGLHSIVVDGVSQSIVESARYVTIEPFEHRCRFVNVISGDVGVFVTAPSEE